MFAKSNVVDEPVNPLFARLADAAGPPSWNFNKYLLDRGGEVVERYDAGPRPTTASSTPGSTSCSKGSTREGSNALGVLETVTAQVHEMHAG